MKKYLMFAMNQYYPSGGWNDLVGSFDTLEEVQAQWEEYHNNKVYDFAHVVDTHKCTIIGNFYHYDGKMMTELYD